MEFYQGVNWMNEMYSIQCCWVGKVKEKTEQWDLYQGLHSAAYRRMMMCDDSRQVVGASCTLINPEICVSVTIWLGCMVFVGEKHHWAD